MTAKRTEVLLLPADELAIESELRSRHPRLCFLDQLFWVHVDEPPVRQSITQCEDMAAMWDPDIVPVVRGFARPNGKIDGPGVGPVIQWLRNYIHDGTFGERRSINDGFFPENARLEAGSWAAAVTPDTDPNMAAFVKDAWRILNRHTTNKLVKGGSFNRSVTVGDSIRTFRVGPAALQAAREGSLVLANNMLRLLPED